MFLTSDRVDALLFFVQNWFLITGSSRSNDALYSAKLANACYAGICELSDDDEGFDLIPCDTPGDLGQACEDLMLFVEGRRDPMGKAYKCPEWFLSQLREGSAFMRLCPPGVVSKQDS